MVTWVLLGYAIGSVPFAFLLARRAGIDVRVDRQRQCRSGECPADVWRRAGCGGPGAGRLARGRRPCTRRTPSAVNDRGDGVGRRRRRRRPYLSRVAAVPRRQGCGGGGGRVQRACAAGHDAGAGGVRQHRLVDAAVSLGSIAATLALPPLAWLSGAPAEVIVASFGSGALILFRHRCEHCAACWPDSERRIGERRCMSERVAILGAGSWGTALAVHCAPHRAPGAAVGHATPRSIDEIARDRANARLSARRAFWPTRHVRRRRSRSPLDGRSRSSSPRCRHTACAAVLRQRRRAGAAHSRPRQRDQGPGGPIAERMSQVMARRSGRHPIAVLSGPSFARRSRARLADRRSSSASADAAAADARPGQPQGPDAPALRQRRRRRRRDRRRAEERHRHRRGRGRGPRARPQRDGGAHHARPGRDFAAGLRRRRPARHARPA